MKRHVFTLSPLPEGKACSLRVPEIVHQIVRVLHLHTGEEILLVDGKGKAVSAEIVGYSERAIDLRLSPVSSKQGSDELSVATTPLIVCAAILKKDHFEWLTEKLAEIGVTDLIPMISARTIKKDVRVDRLQTIAKEAMEQSEQLHLMTIHPPIDPMGAARYLLKQQVKAIVCDTKKKLPILSDALSKIGARAVLVGPEGGWSDEERVFFEQECRFTSASLGASILRGETAGILAGYELKRADEKK